MTCNDTTSVLRLVEDEEALVDEDGVSLYKCFFVFSLVGNKEAREKGGNERLGTWRIIPAST